MISFETFLKGLLLISVLTSLVTEAVKKIKAEQNDDNYYSNTIVGVVSTILSAAVGIGYILLNNIGITTQVGVYFVALVFMSWLCAMVGYDKVIQTISQFKPYGKDE